MFELMIHNATMKPSTNPDGQYYDKIIYCEHHKTSIGGYYAASYCFKIANFIFY